MSETKLEYGSPIDDLFSRVRDAEARAEAAEARAEAAEAALREAREAERWIPIEQEAPKLYMPILIVVRGENVPPTRLVGQNRGANHWQFWNPQTDTVCNLARSLTVVSWRPLPEPPQAALDAEEDEKK